MNLRLIREPSLKGATLGVLFVDGRFTSHTLEDEIRERAGEPVSAWKIPGVTAIPAGRYRVIVTPSHRFKRPLPLLVDVPGFEGIRMHTGNKHQDSEGCILVGRRRDDDEVFESKLAFDELFARIARATGDIWIRIENP